MAEGGGRYNSEWTPRLIRRSRYKYEDESNETSTLMNLLGYGPVIRQKRIEASKESDGLWKAHVQSGVLLITAGSKAEGLTCICESDIDTIAVLPNTVCLEEGVEESTVPGLINVFTMNVQSCIAGYCRQVLVKLAPSLPQAIHDSLCYDEYGSIVLSSSYLLEYFKQYMLRLPTTAVFHARAGPSLPLTNGPFRNDFVWAIRCNCPVILHKWASRARHWPPPDIVEKVIAMKAFVTPIGFKGSEYNHIEWRICFNTAETELVNNLNDTQVKIYVILKMIVNDVLKPKKKEITSYLLKNIVLWQAENNSQLLFHSGSLFHWLHEGLDILRTAISLSQLPYYMIPKRNLMAERGLEVEQQRVLVRSITDIIEEGPRVLLRLNKIRQAIICHPEPLLWYSKTRTELEMLHLVYVNRLLLLKCRDVNFMVDETDTILQALKKRTKQIINDVMWRMLLEGSSVNDWTWSQVCETMLS